MVEVFGVTMKNYLRQLLSEILLKKCIHIDSIISEHPPHGKNTTSKFGERGSSSNIYKTLVPNKVKLFVDYFLFFFLQKYKFVVDLSSATT